MRMNPGALLSAAALVCCACTPTAPSAQLDKARAAYVRASEGAAEQVDPARVREAYQALRAAEAAHREAPRSNRELRLAHLSLRHSEIAMARASEVAAEKERLGAGQLQGARPYAGLLQQKQGELSQANGELARTREQLQQAEQQLNEARQALAQSQQNAQAREQLVQQLMTDNAAIRAERDALRGQSPSTNSSGSPVPDQQRQNVGGTSAPSAGQLWPPPAAPPAPHP